MRESLVSVVIIFLNAERFLEEAVESVRAQSWRAWQLLLVDDGSTDASSEIARRYAAADPERIRYLDHEGHQNRGMSASRNLGVAHAAGEWIAFLDSDDVWAPDSLAMRMEALREHPAAELAYGPATNWYSWDPENPQPDRTQDVGVATGLVEHGARLAEHFVENGAATPCPSSLLIRRDTFMRLGGFEESFRGMYEDQAFCFKAALGARVLVAPRSGLLYRQHENSCCSVEFAANRAVAARLRFLEWAQRHAARTTSHDVRLRETIRQHLRAAWWSTGVAGRVRKAVRRMLPDPFIGWLRAYR